MPSNTTAGMGPIAFHKQTKHMEPSVVRPPMRLSRKFFQHADDEMLYVVTGDVEFNLNWSVCR
jgi:hypothetical protein